MKVIEADECQEVPFLHAAFKSTLNLLRVIVQFGCFFLSVRVQIYEFHLEILTGQNIGLLTFCTVPCSLITSSVVLFISKAK